MVTTTKKTRQRNGSNHTHTKERVAKVSSGTQKVARLKQSRYRLFHVSLRLLPFILGVGCFLSTLFQYYYIQEIVTTELRFVGLIPILFLILTSRLFNYCEYHRVFLYYVAINEIANLVNYYTEPNITDDMFIRLHVILFALTIILTTILYLYAKHKDKNITQSVAEMY